MASPTWQDRQRERRRAEAREKHGPKPIPWFNVCAGCTRPVEGNRVYCSPGCQTAVPSRVERRCVTCGLPWMPSQRPYSQVATECWLCRSHDHVPGGAQLSGVSDWRKAQLVKRENGRCQDCGKTAVDVGEPLHAHHVIPQALDGKDALENLRLLCPDCHSGSGWHRNHAALVQAGLVIPPAGQLAIAA